MTYEIVCSVNKDAEKQNQIKSFLSFFASSDAQKLIEEIGYAPLPLRFSPRLRPPSRPVLIRMPLAHQSGRHTTST